jgi:hypothetical protein
MLFHLSIDADDPKHVAAVIAEMWGGVATQFPSVIEGSWTALAGDDRNSMVEVYPRGTEFVEADGDADAYGVIGANGRRSATHFAMATALSKEQVFAIAAREGWVAKHLVRGGLFGVIELWVENSRMIEVLTPEMQAEYLGNFSVPTWRTLLASIGMGEEARVGA